MTNLYIPARSSFGERVVRSLLRERWVLLGSLTVCLAAAVLIIHQIPSTYESRSKILIESPRTSEQLSSGAQVGLSQLDSVGDRVSPINNQVLLISAYPIYQKALSRLKITETRAPFEGLAVKALLGTDFIEVAYRSDSPDLAAEVVKTVVEVYTEENLLANQTKGSSARKFLEKQLPLLWRTMQATQNQLENFQATNRYLGSTLETDALTRMLHDLEGRVNTLKAEIAFTERKISALKSQFPAPLAQAVDNAGLSQESGFQALQAQVIQAEAQLADLQSRFGPQNPQVLNAAQKLDQLKALLQQRAVTLIGGKTERYTMPLDPLRQRLAEQWFGLEAERNAKNAELQQLSNQLKQLQQRVGQLPLLNKQQTQLQMASDTAAREYLAFKENYTNSRIAEQQRLSNVRVIEPAQVNWMPVSPNRKLLAALAIIGSAGISLLLVWLRTRRSDELEGLIELQEMLPLPVLAVIPWSGDGRISRLEQAAGDLLFGSYDLLHAHLRMVPREVQTMAICSWSPAEGRSSVAANLAWLEVLGGHRVLLIDADGRYPGQPEFWNLDRTPNSRILQEHTPWTDALTPIAPGFDLLPFGEVQMTYRYWATLLEQVKENYSLILIDCPPILHGPNATLISSLADGVLWVACPERLGRKGALASTERLRTWSTRLLGQVVIGLKNPWLSLPQEQISLPSEPSRRRLIDRLRGENL